MDNQILSIKNKNSISGMFASVGASLNSLLSSSDRLIGTNLLVKVNYEDDYTIIPVKILKEDTLASIIEDGINVYESEQEESEDDFDYSDEWKERESQDC